MSTRDVSELTDAIESVQAAPTGLDFATWQSGIPFPDGLAGPGNDPDGDGSDNLLEFAAATDPLNAGSHSPGEIVRSDGTTALRYQVATDRFGTSHRLETGNPEAFSEFLPESVEVHPLSETVNQITVPLPPGERGFVRQVVTLAT